MSAAWRLPSSPFPMWVFDARSDAIVAANDAAVHAYGYSHEGLLARHVRDICPGLSADQRRLLALPAAEGALPGTGAFLQHRVDGTTFEADLLIVETGDAVHGAMMVLVQPRGREQTPVTQSSRHREVA